jgi:hypothetical protein
MTLSIFVAEFIASAAYAKVQTDPFERTSYSPFRAAWISLEKQIAARYTEQARLARSGL